MSGAEAYRRAIKRNEKRKEEMMLRRTRYRRQLKSAEAIPSGDQSEAAQKRLEFYNAVFQGEDEEAAAQQAPAVGKEEAGSRNVTGKRPRPVEEAESAPPAKRAAGRAEPFARERALYEQKVRAKEERRRAIEEKKVEEARKERERRKKAKRMKQRNRRGQPVMAHRVKDLLGKIERDEPTIHDKYKERHGAERRRETFVRLHKRGDTVGTEFEPSVTGPAKPSYS